ncbi:hypothetical protein COV16_03065 [Candidatus Woesearchaeota archaeon CG10_big_fil_rev_8_21_14_0_10_34_8]|nr:MAG: hypothetical protein COV16_03065 [Candidatus Woesearchaeota archaeon CG10_big_fil_rev_8_21_14_0_10_34_8]
MSLEYNFSRDLLLGPDLTRARLMVETHRDIGLPRLRHLYYLGGLGNGIVPSVINYEFQTPPTDPTIIKGRQDLVRILMGLDEDSFTQIERAVASMPHVVKESSDNSQTLLLAGMSGMDSQYVLEQLTNHLPKKSLYWRVHDGIGLLDNTTTLNDIVSKWNQMKSEAFTATVHKKNRTISYDDLLEGRIELNLRADLEREFDKPYQKRLLALTDTLSSFFNQLYPVLSFYVTLAKFGRSLKKMQVGGKESDICCFPEISDKAGHAEVIGFYNPLLGLPEHIGGFSLSYGNNAGAVLSYQSMVYAHDYWSSTDRTHVVLGRNKGSKSTYIVGRGVMQLMAQIGSPIPATSAVIGPVSAIGSVFLNQVSIGAGQSTFSDALNKFGRCLDTVVTSSGLILLDDATEGTDTDNSRDYMNTILELLGRLDAVAYIATQQQRLYHEKPRPKAVFYTTVPNTYGINRLSGEMMPEQVNWRTVAIGTELEKHL